MTDQISTGTTVPIRSCGHDEYWLQDRIADNPSVLRLGELEVISRERKQSSGGRLDMLLKDPEDDSMYEVEIMLGQTDETHIIRTIEYWDNEKRKWPKRKHYAVLVAETVTSRFYNVIHMWMYKRSAGKSLIEFFFTEALLPEGLKVFDAAEVSYAKKKDSVMITADKNMIQVNAKAIQEAAKYVKRSWEE